MSIYDHSEGADEGAAYMEYLASQGPPPDDHHEVFDEDRMNEDELAMRGVYEEAPIDDPSDFIPPLEVLDAESSEIKPFDAFPADMPLSGVAQLRRGLLALDDQRQALAEAGDVDTLALGTADLALVIGDLQDVQRSARRDIAQIMLAGHVDDDGKPKRGNPKHEVAGLGVLDVPGGNEWKEWDSVRLLGDLIKLAMLEPDGELRSFDHPLDVADAIRDVLVMCLPVTGSLGWRVGQFDKATEEWTGLKAAGIDPNDYANHTAKERLAVVPKRKQS